MSYILPCSPSDKPIHAIKPEGAEEHAEENPWVHMQFDKAEQDEQPSKDAQQDGDQPAAAAAADPQKVLDAFANARGELELLLALIAHLDERTYLTAGRVERSDDLRLRDLARDKLSRAGRRTTSLAGAAQALSAGADALAAAGLNEDCFYADLAQLQQYWKLRLEPPVSPYAFSIDLGILPTHSRGAAANNAAQRPSSAAPHAGSASAGTTEGGGSGSGAGGRGGSALTRVGVLKDPAGTLRVQLPPAHSRAVPSVLANNEAEAPPRLFVGPAAVHRLLLSQLKQQLWDVAGGLLANELEAAIGFVPLLPGAAPAAAAPAHRSGSVKLVAGGSAGLDAAAAPAGAPGAAEADAPGSAAAAPAPAPAPAAAPPAAADPRQRLYAMLSLLVLDRVSGAAAPAAQGGGAAGGGLLLPAPGGGAGVPSRDPAIMALRPVVLQYVLHHELQHLMYSASAGAGGARPLGAAVAASGGSRPRGSSLITTLILRLMHGSMRELVRQAVDDAVGRHPGVLVRTLLPSRSCCSALQLVPEALVAAGVPAPGVLLLVSDRDVVVECGLGTAGADPGWALGHQRVVRQVAQLPKVLDQVLPRLLQLGPGPVTT